MDVLMPHRNNRWNDVSSPLDFVMPKSSTFYLCWECRRHVAMTRQCHRFVATCPVSCHMWHGWTHVIMLKTCHDVLAYCLCKPCSSNFCMTCHGDTWWCVFRVMRHVRKKCLGYPLADMLCRDIIYIAFYHNSSWTQEYTLITRIYP
jgi:hypothetical protein